MRKYGFIAPKIDNTHYFLGASDLPKIVIQEDGQWDEFLPIREIQNLNNVETYNCTSQGTLNCLEILYKRLFNKEENYSDRDLGIKAGTSAPGNDPHTVSQAVRHKGIVSDIVLPFSDDIKSIDEYYSYGSSNKERLCIQLGLSWLEDFNFGHEWVFNYDESIESKQKKMMESLKYSPIGVSVYAWKMNEEGKYFKLPEDIDNHWTCVYGYEEGKYWKVFDSYEENIKYLDWNFNFTWAKRYSLSKKEQVKKKTIFDIIKEIWKKITLWVGKL